MGSKLQPLPPRNCKSLHLTSRCRIKISGLFAAMTDLSQPSADTPDPTPLDACVCFCFCFAGVFFSLSSIQDKDCHPRGRGRERLKTYLKSNRLPTEKKATCFTYPVCGKTERSLCKGREKTLWCGFASNTPFSYKANSQRHRKPTVGMEPRAEEGSGRDKRSTWLDSLLFSGQGLTLHPWE